MVQSGQRIAAAAAAADFAGSWRKRGPPMTFCECFCSGTRKFTEAFQRVEDATLMDPSA